MKNKRISGIELLEKIKNDEIKDNTQINVYMGSINITRLIYDGNLEWKPGTFTVSMLWEDELYSFEILPEENDEWENISELKEFEEVRNYGLFHIQQNRIAINKLIKNQKYLKEKLESKDENM